MAPASNPTCFSISPIGIFSLCNSLYLHIFHMKSSNLVMFSQSNGAVLLISSSYLNIIHARILYLYFRIVAERKVSHLQKA